MVEMRPAGPGRAQLLRNGGMAGEARWTLTDLSWPGERVRLARVETFSAPAELEADFRAYLVYLWQKEGVAAAAEDGGLTWFSAALESRWRAAGTPKPAD